MSELVDLALTLFVVSQAIGILLGLVVGILTVIYVTISTLLYIYRHDPSTIAPWFSPS